MQLKFTTITGCNRGKERTTRESISGAVKAFHQRTRGYVNYLHASQSLKQLRDNIPGYTYEDHLHTEEEAEQMLIDANSFIQKYFPWMKDFVIFQLSDGTVRLDAADRAFLEAD